MEETQKYLWIRFSLLFFCAWLLVEVYKQNTEMKSKGKRSLQLCHTFLYFKLQLLFPLPSVWENILKAIFPKKSLSPSFRTEIIKILVKTYKQKVGSNISRCLKKDAFLPLVPRPHTHFSQYLIYFFSVWTNHWLQRKIMQREGFAGCGKKQESGSTYSEKPTHVISD